MVDQHRSQVIIILTFLPVDSAYWSYLPSKLPRHEVLSAMGRHFINTLIFLYEKYGICFSVLFF